MSKRERAGFAERQMVNVSMSALDHRLDFVSVENSPPFKLTIRASIFKCSLNGFSQFLRHVNRRLAEKAPFEVSVSGD
jgi:hypothetical protein